MRSERTRRVGRCYRWGTWGCAALALAAGSASGQQNQQDQWRYRDQMGQQDQWRQDQMQGGMQGGMTIPQLRNFDLVQLSKETQDGREVQVTISEGRIVSAQLDGQMVPQQNVHVQGNTIHVMDQNNRTAAQLRIPRAMAMSGGQRPFATTEPFQQDRFQQDRFEQDRFQQDRFGRDDWRTEGQMGGMGLSHIGSTLGFTASEASSSELRGTRAGERYDQAIRVDRVHNNSPAQNAGLRNGDLIVSIDGRTPATANTFNRVVNELNTNEPLRLTVLRNETPRTITMRLNQQDLRELQQGQGRVFGTTGGFDQGMMLGIQAVEADSRDLQNTRAGNRYNEGILVDQVQDGSPADRHGLQEGDIIVAVDGRTPATPDMLQQRLSEKNRGDTLRLDVIRNGQERNVNVRFDDTGTGRFDRDFRYDRGFDEHGREPSREDHLLEPNVAPHDIYRPSEDASGNAGRPVWDRMRDRVRPR